MEDHPAAPSDSPWLHRYSVLLAAAALFSLITGAAFTSNADRPLYSFGQSHVAAAALVGVLTAGLLIWMSLAERRSWVRRLAWVALATVIAEGLLGFPAMTPAVRFAHAALAQLLFAAMVAVAVFTSRGWTRLPILAAKRPSLRALANLTLLSLLAQEALGVAFRHGILSVMLHVLGALVVVIVVVAVTMSVIYRPVYEPLRPFGVVLLIITALQVFLGLGLLSISYSQLDPAVVITVAVVHAAAAALTLAATVVMAAAVWRSIPARAKQPAEFGRVAATR